MLWQVPIVSRSTLALIRPEYVWCLPGTVNFCLYNEAISRYQPTRWMWRKQPVTRSTSGGKLMPLWPFYAQARIFRANYCSDTQTQVMTISDGSNLPRVQICVWKYLSFQLTQKFVDVTNTYTAIHYANTISCVWFVENPDPLPQVDLECRHMSCFSSWRLWTRWYVRIPSYLCRYRQIK